MTVVPADPRTVVLAWLRPLLPTILPGWTAGAKIAPGVTPSKFVLVKVLGGRQESPISDQTTVAFQLWGDNGISDDHARTSAGRIVTAHAQRGLNARRTSGVVPLPDPTDPARQISQVTITAILRGEDQ